ncbi:MAG: SatD family protein [Limnochordia bacterium]|jgi:predicted DNA-binding protein (UPF0251 family)|nr:hypothetical protein [Bacillota bacterium]
MPYVAAKFDMVGSRKLRSRREVQKRFLHLADEINLKFAEHLAAEFVVTHGDEAQVLLPASKAKMVFRIFEYLSLSMVEVDMRCGVGTGTISTDLQEKSIGMDGEVWQHAKDAIEYAKRKRQIISFFGFAPELQLHLNALGNLLCYLQGRWTKEQLEAICLLSKGHTQKEIAEKLEISQVAVSKRLTGAGWHHYVRGRESLELLLGSDPVTG